MSSLLPKQLHGQEGKPSKIPSDGFFRRIANAIKAIGKALGLVEKTEEKIIERSRSDGGLPVVNPAHAGDIGSVKEKKGVRFNVNVTSNDESVRPLDIRDKKVINQEVMTTRARKLRSEAPLEQQIPPSRRGGS